MFGPHRTVMNQSKGLNDDQKSEHEKTIQRTTIVAKPSTGKNDLEKEPLFGTPQDQT